MKVERVKWSKEVLDNAENVRYERRTFLRVMAAVFSFYAYYARQNFYCIAGIPSRAIEEQKHVSVLFTQRHRTPCLHEILLQ